MTTPVPLYKMMVLDTSQIIAPREDYQRELKSERVKRIVKSFDERIANEPKVSFLVETRSLAGDVPLYLAGKGRALHQPHRVVVYHQAVEVAALAEHYVRIHRNVPAEIPLQVLHVQVVLHYRVEKALLFRAPTLSPRQKNAGKKSKN